MFDRIRMWFTAWTQDSGEPVDPQDNWDDRFDDDLNLSLPADIDPTDIEPEED